ncbi:MAG: PKD domain-containing protein [Bacteroidales bacterium]|nr:PKD domain-containing protein [Bacteroidales bacterium]
MFHRLIRLLFLSVFFLSTGAGVIAQPCPDTNPVITGPDVVGANVNPVQYTTPLITGHTYSWVVTTVPGGTVVGISSTNILNQLWNTPGDYKIDLSEGISGNPCLPVVATSMNVLVKPMLAAYFYYEPDKDHGCYYNEVTFTATGNGNYPPADPLITYEWWWGEYNPPVPVTWVNTDITPIGPNNSVVKILYPATPGKTYATKLIVSKTITGRIWTDEIIDFVYVDPDKFKPIPVIASPTTPNCLIQPFSFSAVGSLVTQIPTTGVLLRYIRWDFGDGTFELFENPDGFITPPLTTTHIYTVPANGIVVTLTLINTKNCEENTTITINVPNTMPVAAFSYAQACVNLPATFTDNSLASIGNITDWWWYWDDGSTDHFNSVTNPPPNPVTHVFTDLLIHNVTLKVRNSNGCEHITVAIPVQAQPSPKADFSYPILSCTGDIVQFTNMSSPLTGTPIATYLWNFNDPLSPSNTSTDPNPTHLFSGPGSYQVTLTVTNQAGCSHTKTLTTNPLVVNPHPDIDFTAVQGATAYIQIFTAQINPAQNVGNNVHWTFGDGTNGFGSPITHTYPGPGSYIATCTGIDMVTGCSTVVEHEVVLGAPPAACFTANPPNQCQNVPVLFVPCPPGGLITTEHWDFGDGTPIQIFVPPSVPASPTHTYLGPGPYYVTRILNQGTPLEVSFSLWVTIYDAPAANFTWFSDPSLMHQGQACDGQLVYFMDQSYANSTPPGTIFKWLWNFDDPLSGPNNTSTLKNPTHAFTPVSLGGKSTYNVTLQAWENLQSCPSPVKQIPVPINPPIPVDFTFNNNVCLDQTVNFTTNPVTLPPANYTWLWNFGDGNTSTASGSVSNLYGAVGNYIVTLTLTDTNGCSKSKQQTVTIIPKPTCNFIFSSPTCFGQAIQFTSQSFVPLPYNDVIVAWQWDFGDGIGTATGTPTPSYTYPTFSSTGYPVTLTVTTNRGCSASKTINVQQIASPVAEFEVMAGTFSCATPQSVQFNSSLSQTNGGGAIVSWLWNFGDLTTSTLQNPAHIYATAGTKTVSLKVTNSNGCSHTITHDIIVNALPVANFTTSVACEGKVMQFTNASTTPLLTTIATYSWAFGDGGISALSSPAHTYSTYGIFQVTLTIVNSNGCIHSVTKPVTVHPNPVAAFTFSPATCVGNPVSFDDLSFIPSGFTEAIQTWEWDFDDGSTPLIINFPANPDVTYTFLGTATTHNVKLTVTTNNGCTAFIVKTVNSIPSPIANYSVSPTTCYGQPVQFTNQSQTNGGGSILSWLWNFGDPLSGALNTSVVQNPTHNFIGVSPFTVTLTVTSTNGCVNTYSGPPITVNALPVANFTNTNACEGNPTTFTNTSVANSTGGSFISYAWNFGDGGVSTQASPQHIYLAYGNYVVTLTVVNDNGCSHTVTRTITVNPKPVADFSFSPASCVGNPVNFFNQSFVPTGFSSYIQTWQWDFGDGSVIAPINFPNPPNITHVFLGTATTHIVRLTVTTTTGCVNFIEKTVTSVPTPIANFSHSNITCDNQPVQFTDLSQTNGGGSIQSWSWNFGDPASGVNNNSSVQHPTHQFSTANTFNITLIVTNGNGCKDTLLPRPQVVVNARPFANFRADTACLNSLTTFTDMSTPAASIVGYLWDFGDGQTSTASAPTHMYATTGNFNVKLKVTSNQGCVKDTTKAVLVLGKPVSSFSYSSPNCAGDSVQFTDLSSTPHGSINKWVWDFDDGTIVTVNFPANQNVKHKFTNGGTYNVKLTITTSDNCTAQKITPVQIGFRPLANFSFPSTSCALTPLQFTDLSQTNGGSSITTWLWNFGDPASGANNTSTTQNPTHTFTTGGPHIVRLMVTNANGCNDSVVGGKTVTVNAAPVAIFSADTSCMASPTMFTDASTTPSGTIIAWAWNFGDPPSGGNNTSTMQNPTHTYYGQGTYNVKLQVTNSNQCKKDTIIPLVVNPKPTAMFQYTASCVNSETQFTDMSIAPGSGLKSWSWDFGDGSPIVTIQNPAHVYTTAGTYQVRLVVTNLANCEDSVTIPVISRPAPVANFTSVSYFCPAGKVDFQDISTATASTIANRLWTFEPGYTSNIANPSHTFSVPNMNYGVSLIVTDTYGCKDTIVDSVFVKPGFTFSYRFDTVCQGYPTQFTPLVLTPGDTLYSVRWNFGDPTSGPANSSQLYAPTHTFMGGPNTYIVKMKAYNTDNCVDSVYREVKVNAPPKPLFSFISTPCHDTIQFTDATVDPGTGAIQNWSWDFGDPPSPDNTSSLQNPAHYYANPGIYKVRLIVTNGGSCIDSISRMVQRFPCIAAGFTYLDTLCARNKIAFSDTSLPVALINQWRWYWGDGKDTTYTKHTSPVMHTYADSGTYPVKLKIWALVDGTNIVDSLISTVKVRPTPLPYFSNVPVCLNQISLFRDTSKTFGVGVSKWNWTFGAKPTDTSRVKNPSHIYDTAGIYNVKLIVKNKFGCKDSLTKPTRIYGLPVAKYDNSVACIGDPTFFTDKSVKSDTTFGFWRWFFGDPTTMKDTSNLKNPSYRYPIAGDFSIRMIVRDHYNCIDTVDSTVKVNITPVSAFTVVNGYNGKQGQVKINNVSTGANSYSWSFGNGKFSTEENPVALFTEDGTYSIRLISMNEFDCSDTTYYKYELLFKGLYVPNAFSPSGTNLGVRLFQPVGINLKQYHVSVFDIWGHLMWESTKLDDKGMPTEGWDGTHQGVLMPQGNYMWKINASFVDDSQWEGSDIGVGGSNKTMGTVSLIR